MTDPNARSVLITCLICSACGGTGAKSEDGAGDSPGAATASAGGDRASTTAGAGPGGETSAQSSDMSATTAMGGSSAATTLGGAGGTTAIGSSDGSADSGGATNAASVSGTGGLTSIPRLDPCTLCDPCHEGTESVDCQDTSFADVPTASCFCEGGPKDDYLVISTCAAQVDCPQAGLVDGMFGVTWDNRQCLLESFRDRAPGFYSVVETPIVNNPDNEPTTTWFFVLTAEGDVLRSATDEHWEDGSNGSVSMHYDEFYPAERCTLSSADYFQNCLYYTTECTEMDEWFEACEATTPSCE